MSNYNTTLQSNNTDLQAILNTINELPEAVEQATPTISVNSTNGLITATAGTKSSTHQLAFQSAKTITPSTASQIAVSSGYYTGGNVTVAGDANLVAGNIKSGVSIFGVNGNYEGSGSGDTSAEDGLIMRTISGTYTNDRVTTIGACAFSGCSNLTTLSFPNATTIGSSAFLRCYNLTTANFPNATIIDNYAFCYCSNLKSLSFPNATTMSIGAFFSCSNLTTANFPNATTIGSEAFCYCSNLTSLSFPVATSIGNYAFSGCSNLKTANFPNATTIGACAFSGCSNLTTLSFPNATTIGSSAFFSCSNLTTAKFPNATTIDNYAFCYCSNLKYLYLTGSSLCKLLYSNAFYSTPIGGYSTSAGAYGSIYVTASLLTTYQAATNWAYFSSRFTFVEDFVFNYTDDTAFLTNTTTNVLVNMMVKSNVSIPSFTINSDNESIASISNMVTSNDGISFDIVTYENEGEAMITINATNGSHSQTQTLNISVWNEIPECTYTVESVGDYGFTLNNNGYYESTNKGKSSSYAMCKVNIYAPINSTMCVDCINYAENNYDYGFLSNLDTVLTSSASADSSNVYTNFKSSSSANVQTVTYDVPSGEHFIYIKFIKDFSGNSNNDSLQFKIRFAY